MIARFLNLRNRDLILQLFRTNGPMKYENHTISAYPDFTAEVQKQRSSYTEVKACLRSAKMKYALLFPAKLRVVDGDTTHFFQKPEAAWQWLRSKGLGPAATEQDDRDWSTRKTRRRRGRGPCGHPSPERAAVERSKLLSDIISQDSNRYRELSRDSDQDSVGGTGRPSVSVGGASVASSSVRNRKQAEDGGAL